MTLGEGAVVSMSKNGKLYGNRACWGPMVFPRRHYGASILLRPKDIQSSRMFMFQDNEATMRIEINGKLSSSKHTKHIKRGYVSIKDKIEDEDIEV